MCWLPLDILQAEDMDTKLDTESVDSCLDMFLPETRKLINGGVIFYCKSGRGLPPSLTASTRKNDKTHDQNVSFVLEPELGSFEFFGSDNFVLETKAEKPTLNVREVFSELLYRTEFVGKLKRSYSE